MDNLGYALQVAGLGIVIVLTVLVFLIFLVTAQKLFLNYLDEKKKKEVNGNNEKMEFIESEATVEEVIDAGEEELSPEVVAAITAAVYQIVNQPVRIATIRPIFPQQKKNWKKASIQERFSRGKQLLG
ncbi:Na+-transporting methylmalonyl-CoA/oxaloacetate decarboxylase gamma subunit [Desulfitispora alkaliphila]|uniref:OadG family protein n=1 Tax=Desulfitispora alkaliphila TaxID=622674 RepID=UPI003D1EF1ED